MRIIDRKEGEDVKKRRMKRNRSKKRLEDEWRKEEEEGEKRMKNRIEDELRKEDQGRRMKKRRNRKGGRNGLRINKRKADWKLERV